MKKKNETEIEKVILMMMTEIKPRGNEDDRKGKMKNKGMLDEN